MQNVHINLDYLDLMTDGDCGMRQTMLEMIIEEIPSEMDKMRHSWEQGDFKAIKEISHKMKSTLAFVGNDSLTEANRAIEQTARSKGRPSEFGPFFVEIDKLLPLVLAELNHVASMSPAELVQA